MANRSINLTFDIDDDGSLSLRQPGARAAESFVEATSAASADEADTGSRPADYDVPFDPDYSPTGKRKGYDPAFLGKGNEVLLPTLGTALQREATPLLDHPNDRVIHLFEAVCIIKGVAGKQIAYLGDLLLRPRKVTELSISIISISQKDGIPTRAWHHPLPGGELASGQGFSL